MTERMKNYYFLKEVGICVRCQNKSAAKGRVHCLDCLEGSIRENNRKRREAMTKEQYEEHVKANKERKIKYVQMGLCRNCGKPSHNGTCYCYECRIKNKRSCKEKRQKHKKQKQPWECKWCEKPAASGKRLCVECCAKCRPHGTTPKENHRWKKIRL